jgi:iron complex outermembrane receptor protein
MSWQATDDFRIYGGVGYADAHYTEFTNAIISTPFPFAVPNLPPGACAGTFGDPNNALGGNCLQIGDAGGNRLQNTPALTASLGASYDIHSALGTFTLAGNYYYNDGFVATADERVEQPSYSTIDASLTWRPTPDSYFVRLWGRNLSDEFYRTQLSATNSGDNGTSGVPRTYGVQVGMEF